MLYRKSLDIYCDVLAEADLRQYECLSQDLQSWRYRGHQGEWYWQILTFNLDNLVELKLYGSSNSDFFEL